MEGQLGEGEYQPAKQENGKWLKSEKAHEVNKPMQYFPCDAGQYSRTMLYSIIFCIW